ncbi:UspA domain protein [Natronomonas pharaonis DSM 2160]|uniref:UspA domain protein n=1 Tax=Natronomonas pharaonis (strain ATCC 35678 / DSM 2160 / CIP 103997 / JCM 8858 / NBRC 14720 / NCIMB 2260 / Gabara) TaxID=348780 RepID=A0A1U7EUX2_NATPD|nr:universal stress protein [Natronomonas pharaonis]CAI48806.1 UspA domain protein [Natronomonas pharaonis DSM 2160]
MFETVVVATDGSASVSRAVDCTLDLASKFDATVHALYVVDEGHLEELPTDLEGDIRDGLDEQGQQALNDIVAANERREDPVELETAVRVGHPEKQIVGYVRDVDADGIAMGTRGRSGEHSFLLGSVAERVVRTCPVPVLTVRQLEGAADTAEAAGG